MILKTSMFFLDYMFISFVMSLLVIMWGEYVLVVKTLGVVKKVVGWNFILTIHHSKKFKPWGLNDLYNVGWRFVKNAN